MAEPITSIGFLKSILPTIVGASISLWYEKDRLKWNERTGNQKIGVIIFAMFAWIFTIITAWYLGGALIEHFDVKQGSFTASAVNIVVALHILKIISISHERIEGVMNTVFDGITKYLKGFFHLGD